MKEEKLSSDSKNFNSVVSLPVDFLRSGANLPLLDLLPPPQLHLVLGITSSLFKHLEILNSYLANAWLRKLGVRRNPSHGASGFTGNDCRRIISHTHQLRNLPEFPQRTSRSHASAANATTVVLLADAINAFNDVVTKTMRPYLHPQWRASIEQFRVTFNSFTQQFETVQPISAARDPSTVDSPIKSAV